jgi:integrase
MEGTEVGRRATSALTALQVANLAKIGYTADGLQPGLNVQVTRSGESYVRSWVFRYTSPTTRKRREIGLGSIKTRSLADARARAAEFGLLILDGTDPKEHRDNARAEKLAAAARQLTFEGAATQCIAAKSHEWRSAKHAAQWTATLEAYAYPSLGKLPVAQVTTEAVLRVLDPIWTTKTETATRVRQRIETVLDWAKARKLISGDNPASLKGGLGQLLPKARKVTKVQHQPALPYLETYAFVQALRSKRGIGPRALEFLLLTAARSSEVVKATWDEFDLDTGVWTIPAERTKAQREHRVPLNARARNIIGEMLAGSQCAFVFPDPSGKRSLSNGTLLALMKGMPAYANYVPHGLRSTFRDWAAERTEFANETLELALAHTLKDKTEAAYRRGDQLEKRAALMKRWGDFVETQPVEAVVVNLADRRYL